jgi:hypothetical protein
MSVGVARAVVPVSLIDTHTSSARAKWQQADSIFSLLSLRVAAAAAAAAVCMWRAREENRMSRVACRVRLGVGATIFLPPRSLIPLSASFKHNRADNGEQGARVRELVRLSEALSERDGASEEVGLGGGSAEEEQRRRSSGGGAADEGVGRRGARSAGEFRYLALDVPGRRGLSRGQSRLPGLAARSIVKSRGCR